MSAIYVVVMSSCSVFFLSPGLVIWSDLSGLDPGLVGPSGVWSGLVSSGPQPDVRGVRLLPVSRP